MVGVRKRTVNARSDSSHYSLFDGVRDIDFLCNKQSPLLLDCGRNMLTMRYVSRMEMQEYQMVVISPILSCSSSTASCLKGRFVRWSN